MFIPLAVGFVLVVIAYIFTEIKGNLVAGKKVDSY